MSTERNVRIYPSLSVVVPTFNRAGLLKRAINSVINQTYRDLEIVIVDDASEDNIKEVVEECNDDRITYIRHEQNRGGSSARNTGIRAALGKYIAFLDDDDEWELEKTEEQLKVLKHYDAVLCTSNESSKNLAKHKSKKIIDLEDLRRGHFTAGGTGVLMAKSYVLKHTMFDEELPRYQDWDLFIRIAQKYTIGYLNKPLVRYNEGEHERISNKIANMPISQLEAELRMVHKHKAFFGDRWFKWHMCRALLYGIKHRSDRGTHISYVIRQYGLSNVTKVFVRRFLQRAAEEK